MYTEIKDNEVDTNIVPFGIYYVVHVELTSKAFCAFSQFSFLPIIVIVSLSEWTDSDSSPPSFSSSWLVWPFSIPLVVGEEFSTVGST